MDGREVDFFKIYSNYIFQSIRTIIPARIERFDATNMLADVQPLLLQTPTDGGQPVKMGLLQDLPVLNWKFAVEEEVGVGTGLEHRHETRVVTRSYKTVYTKGDIVFIGVCDRNIDNLQNQPFLPNSNAKFNVNDAIVLGGWKI